MSSLLVAHWAVSTSSMLAIASRLGQDRQRSHPRVGRVNPSATIRIHLPTSWEGVRLLHQSPIDPVVASAWSIRQPVLPRNQDPCFQAPEADLAHKEFNWSSVTPTGMLGRQNSS